MIGFAKGDWGASKDAGLNQSQLLQSVMTHRKAQSNVHSLHLAHGEALSDLPEWWHGTVLRLAIVTESATRFATGRSLPDHKDSYKRAMVASFILHQQALDARRDEEVEHPRRRDVDRLLEDPSKTASLPGDEGLDWEDILRDGRKLRWAGNSMREDGLFEPWYDGFVRPALPNDGLFVRLLHLGDEALYGTVLSLLLAVVLFVSFGWGPELATLGVSAFAGVLLLWLAVPVPPICAPQSLAADAD